jgi:hypothetical protein
LNKSRTTVKVQFVMPHNVIRTAYVTYFDCRDFDGRFIISVK